MSGTMSGMATAQLVVYLLSLLFLVFLFTGDLVVKVIAVGNDKFQNGQGKKSKYGEKGKVLLSNKPVS